MGNNPTLTQTDLTRLQGETTFSQKEIKRIFKRFAKLDKYGRGGVTTHDLCVLPEIDKNPMGDRVCSVLGGTDNIVDFELFVKTLSDFNQREESEAKLKFLFKIYDVDNDGFVTREELLVILKTLVLHSLKDDQLEQIVDRTIDELDLDGDGKLNYEEFKQVGAGGRMNQVFKN